MTAPAPAEGPAAAAPGTRFVSTGSVVVDVPLSVPHLPERGGDVLAGGGGAVVGGGFNVVAAAARQGADVTLASPVGTGQWGTLVRAALGAEGVTVLTAPAEGDTGLVLTLVEPDGERTFVTTVGVEGRPRAEELAAVPVQPGDVVYVSGYDLAYPAAAPVVSAWAARLPAGVRLLLDPGPLAGEIDAVVLGPVLARCDVLTVNAREAMLLSGVGAGDVLADAGSPPPVLAAVRRLVPGSCAVLVRVGERGCWVSEAAGAPARLVPSRLVRAVDSTGAGDAHTGILAAALLTGAGLPDAVRRANLGAALAVTRPGPATAPSRAELDELLLEA
ncbi:sugar kinase [Georgenia yuyongxinii]|uniref:Sugar kinase n=1 Tax=Georgenia yuyongxinii TaxID=2589797 RepID=A0A5B8C481_9MICO|nr:PfkB family carbohydrate kinase [Georgenia yuyongxinii]QDC24291.1 sugar kinase [Georgenia yuyongxinii]